MPVALAVVARPEVAAHLGVVVDSATVVVVVALSVVAAAPGVDSVTVVAVVALSVVVVAAHPGVAAGAVTKLLARVLTSWKRTKMMHIGNGVRGERRKWLAVLSY